MTTEDAKMRQVARRTATSRGFTDKNPVLSHIRRRKSVSDASPRPRHPSE
jgi:hypothetical protein